MFVSQSWLALIRLSSYGERLLRTIIVFHSGTNLSSNRAFRIIIAIVRIFLWYVSLRRSNFMRTSLLLVSRISSFEAMFEKWSLVIFSSRSLVNLCISVLFDSWVRPVCHSTLVLELVYLIPKVITDLSIRKVSISRSILIVCINKRLKQLFSLINYLKRKASFFLEK